jgi:hypothetical protein
LKTYQRIKKRRNADGSRREESAAPLYTFSFTLINAIYLRFDYIKHLIDLKLFL